MSEMIIKADKAVIRQQKVTILKDVTLEIESGEFIYIIGKVGSGKSSFLKTLYAELPLEYGNLEVAGFQLKKIKKSQVPLLRRKCGIVFQDFKLLTDRNVYANLEFVLKATGWKNKKAIEERIDTVLNKVEMPDKKFKMPHELSGGEQQRIVLARALLNAPPIILADEPTGNIDPETSYRLVELLKDLSESGKTILIATHQYDLIKRYPGRVLRCENGTLTEDEQLTVRPHTLAPADIESIENTPLAEEATPAAEGLVSGPINTQTYPAIQTEEEKTDILPASSEINPDTPVCPEGTEEIPSPITTVPLPFPEEEQQMPEINSDKVSEKQKSASSVPVEKPFGFELMEE